MLSVFAVALSVRLVGVLLTTVTGLNTYAQTDANTFARSGAYIADGLRRGVYTLPPETTGTIDRWATVLAPFWLIPGPSRIYARIGIALLGAYAVYNVFTIARAYTTRDGAFLAVAPMIVYPSFIFIHSSVIREAAILFGITTAARLLIAPPKRLHPVTTYVGAGALLWFASILRPENRPIFILVLSIAAVVRHRTVINRALVYYLALPAIAAVAIAVRAKVPAVLDRLANIRGYRARGRTAYLSQTIPETVPSAIAFSWLGAVYFLFAPFPWMVSQIPDFVVLFEGMTNLAFAIAGLYGFRLLLHRNAAVAISLAVGVVLGAVLYGLANANVGTVVRQRQMIIWAIFVFGGIGVAEHVGLSLSSDPTPDSHGNRPTTD